MDDTCLCGKKRLSLNTTNWSRHVISCKKKRVCSGNSSITNFFKVPVVCTRPISSNGMYYFITYNFVSFVILYPL